MNGTNQPESNMDKRQKQIGLWTAGVFTILSAVFVGIEIYLIAIDQQGRFDVTDPVILPALIVIFVIGLLSYFLIRRGRYEMGINLLLFIMMILPVIITLVVNNFKVVVASYITIFVLAIFTWVIPKSGRRRAAIITALGILAIIGIEIWNPGFRIPAPVAVDFVPPFFILAALVILAFVAREAVTGSLRNKLVTTFLAVTIIPLAITGYITYRSSQTALTDAANAKLSAAAGRVAADIDQFISLNLDVVRTSAQFSDIVDYLLLPADQRTGSLTEENVKKLLTAMSRQDPVFISSVAVYDANGIDVADTSPADVGLDKSNRVYFKNTVTSGLPYVSDIEYSSTTGVPSIYFSAPVRDAAGRILGIIRVRYFSSILQQAVALETGLAGESSYAVLIDSHHVRLANGTDRNLIFKSIVPLNSTALINLQAQGLMPAGTPEQLSTNLPDFEAGLNNLAQIPYFASDTNGDGILEQAAFATLKNRNWSVAFIQSQSVFLAPVNTQTTNNLLAAFIVAALVGVVGFFFSQTLSGPVTRLTQVAQAIADGNINIQAKVETTDEIGTLAGTFNRMTQQLRDFIASLEERVAARTKDLATVAAISTQTSTIQDPFQMLATAVRLTQRGFGLYHAHVFTYHKDSGELQIVACGYKEGDEHEGTHGTTSIPIMREQSLVARAGRTQKPVIVNDVHSDPGWLPNPLLPDTHAEMAVPMIVGDELLGVLDVQADHVDAFTDADANIQMTLASQIATALKNAQSYSESKAQAELESLVNAVGQKIQRTTTVEDTLQVAIRELSLVLGAQRVSANIKAGVRDGYEKEGQA